MNPGQNRNPALRPELGHHVQLVQGGLGRQAKDGGVRVADPVVLVDIGDQPLLVGETHSFQLLRWVVNSPAVVVLSSTLFPKLERKELACVGQRERVGQQGLKNLPPGMATSFSLSQDELQGPDVLADHLETVGVTQLSWHAHPVHPWDQAERKVEDDRSIFVLLVGVEVEAVVGDRQGASDQGRLWRGERTKVSDLLAVAAGDFTIEQADLDMNFLKAA